MSVSYVWPHRKQKNLYSTSTNGQALPYDMDYHTVNNKEHPWSSLRRLAGTGFHRKGQQFKGKLVLS